MFGVTHVLAVDGYSGMIVSHVTIPIKNNRLIYEHIYRLVLIIDKYCFIICTQRFSIEIWFVGTGQN